MAVLHHTGHSDINISAVLHVGQYFIAEISIITSVIVESSDIYDRVEEFFLNRRIFQFRFQRQHMTAQQPLRCKEPPVLLRIAQRIDGIDLESVLLREEYRGKAFAAAEVAYDRTLAQRTVFEQLLGELDWIRAGQPAHECCCAVFSAARIFIHGGVRFSITAYSIDEMLKMLFQQLRYPALCVHSVVKVNKRKHRPVKLQRKLGSRTVPAVKARHFTQQILGVLERPRAEVLLEQCIHLRRTELLQCDHASEA